MDWIQIGGENGMGDPVGFKHVDHFSRAPFGANYAMNPGLKSVEPLQLVANVPGVTGRSVEIVSPAITMAPDGARASAVANVWAAWNRHELPPMQKTESPPK